MESAQLTADMTVEEVSARWPQAVPVIRHYAEACVGCSLAPFCTLAEAAREFGVDLDRFLSDLKMITGQTE
jgi:hybrid cluster-associated redox disulfide protein